ncbi:PCC domain-containing protein [Haloglycomyces albus]|uniref:PCC domain-containing protein n=1 Tax=Haloglycomyces albus TaxID=526067 RepID=UPI0004AC570C|nr:DUF296 domain-containing protein [Haloglycomyces albus]
MLALDIRSGELLDEIATRLDKRGIDNAALSIIGGVNGFEIINMSAADATQRDTTTYDQPAEMIGTGELTDGHLHVHVSCGLEGGHARVGHLKAAWVDTWFVKVHVSPVDEVIS